MHIVAQTDAQEKTPGGPILPGPKSTHRIRIPNCMFLTEFTEVTGENENPLSYFFPLCPLCTL